MRFKNPIIKAFNPDPSICKVVRECNSLELYSPEYYLVTSSFEYFSGLPLYYSTDLVNWELIGNCINRPEQLPMETARPSGGIWAPTIRYHKGIFYITATFSELGNFIIHADEKEMIWSDPLHIDIGGIDPSLFFEDDRVYYCTNHQVNKGEEGIALVEIDIKTGELKGEIKSIWSGMKGGFLEAPHIYHIGEYYYLLVAEGGTGVCHMANIARSHNIWGPYEACPHNPILTNRNDVSKQVLCAGHGDLVFDNDGKLWMVHLGTRPSYNQIAHLGRETFLSPMKVTDGWVLAEDTKARLENEAPKGVQEHPITYWQDDFQNESFGPEWLFVKKQESDKYIRKDNSLTLYPSTVELSDEKTPVFAAVRPLDMIFNISTSMDFSTYEAGDEAGLTMYLSPKFHYKLAKKREADGDYIIVEKLADDFEQVAFHQKIATGKLTLLIKAGKEKFDFYYAIADGELIYMCSASTRFLTCEIENKYFTGTITGLYAQCKKNTEAEAVFYYIRQEST